MDKIRQIDKILTPPPVHMVGDGFRVHNFFPGGGVIPLNRLSPFFLLDYASKHTFSPTERQRGVGVHPHRGFETVTLAYYGKVAHHDSAGNSGIIHEGDIQWMTAASGILHKEYHEREWSKKGGIFQMVQLWVNLPAKYKMSLPKYQSIKQSDLGKFTLPNNQGVVEVIAGKYDTAVGPASTFTPIEMYNVRLNKNAVLELEFPENYNTAILIVEGNVRVNGTRVPENHLIIFENEGINIELTTNENAIVLILSGEPINEPIYPYGPFLMNNKQEIMQAYKDLDDGKFGTLE